MVDKKSLMPLMILAIVVVVLTGCNRGGGEEDTATDTPDVQLEEQVNKFLEENNVQVSENGERANLSGTNNSGSSGVVTKEPSSTGSDVMVLAALPEPTSGSYHAWVKTGEDTYDYVGPLTRGKGGYLVERAVTGEAAAGKEVVVSREDQVGEAPTEIVLEGSF